ncbi:hypothetical protein POM88_020239 [Heracleum sosnowskyi]|uniref:Uncharacterized protein n=1 Tax=Heracleum sosnowskyi TaxID=360622 RepID=A0AAD8MRS4_9APIA|nr:hypothetical protein POM88_020239 [Heracleum sosnowskyi]
MYGCLLCQVHHHNPTEFPLLAEELCAAQSQGTAKPSFSEVQSKAVIRLNRGKRKYVIITLLDYHCWPRNCVHHILKALRYRHSLKFSPRLLVDEKQANGRY